MTTSPVTTITDELLAEIESGYLDAASAMAGRDECMMIAAISAELRALRAKTTTAMGVGFGDGQLFVHGDYESIRAVQRIVIERDKLRSSNAALISEAATWEMRACKEATACVELRTELESCRRDAYLKGLVDQKAAFENAYASTSCWNMCESKTSDGLRAMDSLIDAAMQEQAQ